MPRKKLQNRIENLFAELKNVQEKVKEDPEPIKSSDDGLSSIPDSKKTFDADVNFVANKEADIFGMVGDEVNLETEKPLVMPVIDTSDSNVPTLNQSKTLSATADSGGLSSLKVPFSVRGRPKAFLEVSDNRSEQTWGENDRKLVEQVADQLSLALENAYLFQETQTALAEAKALYAISQAATRSVKVEEILYQMTLEILKAVGLDAGIITIFDESKDHDVILSSYNLTAEFLDKWQNEGYLVTINKVIAKSKNPLIFTDLSAELIETLDPLLIGIPFQLLVKDNIFAIHGTPIYSKGNLLGTLVAFGFSPWAHHEISHSLFLTACQQIGIAIENARLFSDEKERRRVADALLELASVVSSSLELKVVTERMLSQLHLLVDYQVASIQLVRNERRELIACHFSGVRDTNDLDQHILAEYTNDLLNTAAVSQSPILIGDTLQDKRWSSSETLLSIRAWLCSPLLVGGEVLGFLVLEHSEPGIYTQDTASLTMAFASQAAIAIRNASLFEQVQNAYTETEKLYQATTEINTVQTFQDILEILNKVTFIGVDQFASKGLYLFNESVRFSDLTFKELILTAHMVENKDVDSWVLKENLLSLGKEVFRHFENGSYKPEKIFIVNNFSRDAEIIGPNLLEIGDNSLSASILYVPLSFGGQWLGFIVALSSTPIEVEPSDLRQLNALATQASTAIQNIKLLAETRQAYFETQQRVQELSQLYSVSHALSSATMQTTEIAHTVVKEFVTLFDVERASLLLHETSENSLRILAVAYTETGTSGESSNTLVKSEKIPKGSLLLSYYPAVEEVMQSLHPLTLHREDELFPILEINLDLIDPALVTELIQKFTETLILIPLSVKGHSIGIIQLESQQRDPQLELTLSQLNLAMTIANAAAVVLENAQLYEDQLETSEKLRDLDKLKSQFLANMSHELRTPLNSIIGFSRVILKGIDGPITDVQQQDLSAIHNAGTHLLELINDVLDVSKIEAGKMELAFDDEVSLPDLIESAMSTAVGLTKDKPIRLERDIADNLPLVRADPTRIRQILINFLSNAAKFTDQGVITVRAFFNPSYSRSDRAAKQEIVISVSDTGPGISINDQDKLFRPFSQVDNSPTRKVGGSGLGLSISRLLVELHGGQIGVDSEPGRGSTFYFTLPIQSGDDTGDTGEERLTRSTIQEPSGKTILIIDDDRQVIKLYERYLNNYGYNTVSLSDSTLALEKARELEPFAITLDIMMPRMDGWQVLEALKNDPETKSIPVLICSILENEEKGLRLGAFDYLSKPILEEDLIRVLNKLSAEFDEIEVLVIDDDPEVLRLVKKVLLTSDRYRVRSALNGTEGLVAIQTRPPDIIILDLLIPEVDGFTVLEMVKQDPVFQKIPIIIFTAGELNEIQLRKIRDWSVDLLYKSEIKSDDFLKSIRRALNHNSKEV